MKEEEEEETVSVKAIQMMRSPREVRRDKQAAEKKAMEVVRRYRDEKEQAAAGDLMNFEEDPRETSKMKWKGNRVEEWAKVTRE